MNDRPNRDLTADMCRAALDALPEPVLIYDGESVLYANAAASSALGGSATAELVGTPVGAFIFPELADVNNARRAWVVEQGVELHDLVIKIRGIDGEPKVLNVDIKRITFDGSYAAMATLAKR